MKGSDEWPNGTFADVPTIFATASNEAIPKSARLAGTVTTQIATNRNSTTATHSQPDQHSSGLVAIDPLATAGLVPSSAPSLIVMSMARMRPATPPEMTYPAICTRVDIDLTKRMATYSGYEYMGLGLITRAWPWAELGLPPSTLPPSIAPCEIMYAYHHQPPNAIVWWVPDFLADLGYESPSATCTITVPIERDAGDIPRRNSVTIVIDGKEYDREVGTKCQHCDQTVEVPCVNMQRATLTMTYEWRTVIDRTKVIEVK